MDAIVLIVEIVVFLIFQSVKFNDSLFLRVAIVIFCTQYPCVIFYQNKRGISICKNSRQDIRDSPKPAHRLYISIPLSVLLRNVISPYQQITPHEIMISIFIKNLSPYDFLLLKKVIVTFLIISSAPLLPATYKATVQVRIAVLVYQTTAVLLNKFLIYSVNY